MNEKKYIQLTNLTVLRIVKRLLIEIIQGDGYHVPEDEFMAVYIAVDKWTSNLVKETYITDED